MDDVRYPIGKFQFHEPATLEQRRHWIADVAQTPARMRDAVRGLSTEQLDTPYRPGGWTVRQVVHHVPDSHLNAYVRFRLALTEDAPMVKTYEEARWAELPDARQAPIKLSLDLLDAVHGRLVLLLESLTPEQWKRTYRHPEMGDVTLERVLAMYSWHGRHHVAHITSLRERMGW